MSCVPSLIVPGMVKGFLQVGHNQRKRGSHLEWECLCACGTVKYMVGSYILRQESPSCGCRRGNHKAPYLSLYNTFVKTCRERSIKCDMTYEEFVTFTSEEQCSYCHTSVAWTKSNLEENGCKYNLDRKDNRLEYSVSNCIVCCWKCNKAKGDRYTYKEWWNMTAYFRRTEQMKSGDVVVHKSMGGQPLVVIGVDEHTVIVRYGTQGRNGVGFETNEFLPEELETPVESIEREGEIFRALNEKKRDIETPQGKLIPIN